MINVYLSYRELPRIGDAKEILIECNIDNILCIKKHKQISGCTGLIYGKRAIAAQMLKAYRESIRDYLYIVNGEFGLKQRMFERILFRPVWQG